MPRLLLLLITNALLLNCCNDSPASKTEDHRPPPAVGAVVDTSRAQTIRDSLAVLATASDTFKTTTGQVFWLEKISRRQYELTHNPNQKKVFPPDSAAAVAVEHSYLKAVAGHVWRIADTLFFKTKQGTVVKLKDGPTYQDAEDSYEGYRFLDNLRPIRQWLVEVGKWEGRYYLLIDQQTGKRTDLISYPVISPDQHHFVCANSSPTGYDWDGLQLWNKPQGAPPELRWQCISNMQPGIAALSPRWENAKTLVFCEDLITAQRYIRIRL